VRRVTLADAGGGAGIWTVRVEEARSDSDASVEVPESVSIPGELSVTVRAAAESRPGDRSGWIVLAQNGAERRIPFWFRVTRPELQDVPAVWLAKLGTHKASNGGRPSRVNGYRYPDEPYALIAGPERVFRLRVAAGLANLGVAVVDRDPGVVVDPRIVRGSDENRLAGPVALPVVTNPYLATVDQPRPIAGLLFPQPGLYSIVFDSPDRSSAGRFAFRVWVDDTTPPRVDPFRRSGRILTTHVGDAGAGIDPASIRVTLDGRAVRTLRYDSRKGTVRIDLEQFAPGRHRLVLVVADRQAAKNTENVPRPDPNTATRTLTLGF
jgi:hypothetical protein